MPSFQRNPCEGKIAVKFTRLGKEKKKRGPCKPRSCGKTHPRCYSSKKKDEDERKYPRTEKDKT